MIRRKALHAKWARKVLNSRNFIVLTDKESVIYFGGLDAKKFNDVLMLTAQGASLTHFRDELDRIIKEHDKIKEEVFNEPSTKLGVGIAKKSKPKTTKAKATKKAPKARKIKVTDG